MRRGMASLIMGLSLLVATMSWAGFVLSRTVLDPGRSERLADHLLDNESVRTAIVGRMADALQAQVPAEIPVTRGTVELAAELALDDPRVEALIRDGIVRTHQNALNGVDEPILLDATALGQAGRDALVTQVPALGLVLPETPSVQVELPSAGLGWLGSVKAFVDRYTLIGALLSLIGVTVAFLITSNRPAALRRVSYWAFGSSAFWLVVGYALPAVLGVVAPSSLVIAAAAVDVFFGAMIGPAVTLAIIGAVLLGISLLWPAVDRRRPAASLERAARARRASMPPRHPAPPPAPAPARPGPRVTSPAHPGPVTPAAVPPAAWPGPESPGAGPDATALYPQISSGGAGTGAGATGVPTAADTPEVPSESLTWIPGVGYVNEQSAPVGHDHPAGGPISGSTRDR